MKRVWLCWFAFAAAPPLSASPETGWQALARLKADEALREFAGAESSDASARFGHAVGLLIKQPLTSENVEAAAAIFAALARTERGELRSASSYFLGRIAQHHRETPDVTEARRRYRQLLETDETSLWAQTALTRLAVLEIYPAEKNRPPAECVAAGEKLLAKAHLPAAESELHLVLADAIFYYDLPAARALPHLLAAERLGQLDAANRADVLVQIAEVSALAGDRAQARRFYETFLTDFPRDQRIFMVRQKLAQTLTTNGHQ